MSWWAHCRSAILLKSRNTYFGMDSAKKVCTLKHWEKKMRSIKFAPAVATIALTLGCQGRDPAFDLEAFSSCEQLVNTIQDQAITEIRWDNAWGGFSGGFGANDFAMVESSAMSDGRSSDEASVSSGGHSTTNNQVEGVDELDIMETDGEYIYTVAGDHLMISKVWPPEEAAVAGQIQIEGNPKGLFLLEDDTIVVLSQLGWGESGAPASGKEIVGGQDGLVKVAIIDVADTQAPAVLRETYTRGILFDARMKEDRLFTVSYVGLRMPSFDGIEGKSEQISAVKDSVLEDWMPLRYDNVRDGISSDWSSIEEDFCACENVYGSKRGTGDYFVSVQSLDVSSHTSAFEGSAVLSSMDHIYASEDSIYVVSQEQQEGPWSSYDDSVDTVIHRFKVDENSGVPAYQSSGKVPGYTLNQFSLDQSGETLRVATTKSAWQGGNGESNLYILEDDGDELDLIGSVEGLAAGEQIYAVRYVEDTAYVVTFEQTDPLFTIDLSDPVEPVLRGELHITGFSNYLHPLADGSLLGIGLDVDENGWESRGVQVSRFDVSDLDNPALAERLTLESTSWSEAQNDHHAFNYYAPTESLSVPAYDESVGGSQMYVLRAGPDVELGLIGTLSQQDLLDETQMEDWSYRYCTEFQRSVVIEGNEEAGIVDTVYALSNAGIVAAPVDQPGAVTASVKYNGIDVCQGNNYYYW